MAGLLDIFSNKAGQERSRKLNQAIEYYTPPELRGLLNFFGEMSPTTQAYDAGTGFNVAISPNATTSERIGGVGQMLSGMAGIAAPAALEARFGKEAANVIADALTSLPAKELSQMATNAASDLTYAGRSAVEGDVQGLLDAFRTSREGQSVGAALTKEQLDPQRLSKIKMPSHVSDIEYKATPTGDLGAKKTISIEDLQGSTLIPAYGDRTYGGATLESIGDVKLNQPVDMQGGHDFMRDQRTGLWASEESAMTPKARFIDDLIAKGEDPRMIYTAMGGQSGDFSHHMADATMGLVEQSNITKKAAKEYDDIIKEKLDPNWVGILSPKAKDYLHNNMTGTLRRELWQEMDKDKWKKMGFPHLGLARVSITDPDLLTVDPFSAGLSIGKPTGGGLLDLSNKTPHKTYDSQIGGEYLGGLPDQVSGEMIFRDFFGARRAAGIPSAGDQRSFMMSPYTKQLVDQQMVDEVSRYLENLRGRR